MGLRIFREALYFPLDMGADGMAEHHQHRRFPYISYFIFHNITCIYKAAMILGRLLMTVIMPM